VALLSATAFADHDPFLRAFDAVAIKHGTGMDSGLSLDGARLLPAGSFEAKLLFDLNVGLMALKLGDEKLGDLIPARFDAHLLLAYQLHQRIELGLDLPLTLYQVNNFGLLAANGFPQPGIAAFALGDVRAVVRVGLLTEDRFPVSVTAIGELRVPTGDHESFTGDLRAVFAPRVAVERSFGNLRVMGNAGVRLRDHGQFLNLYVGHEVTFGAGALFRLPWSFSWAKEIDVMGEVHLATPFEAPFTFSQADSLKTPFEFQVGARAQVFKRFGVELGIGKGLGIESGYGRETFRLFLAVSYGVNKATQVDLDNDTIYDGEDACPAEPEDLDGFQDTDGCPDPDNDGDGVPDQMDQCPMDPGPAELDGCPDRDGDEIPDVVDQCPDVPGPAEKEGCPYEDPQVTLESDRIRVRGSIVFETASAKIQPRSFGMLDEVFKVLKDNPDVGPVQVEGHTDNRGSRAYNVDLSARRAKSVVEYLVKKGIDRKRLRSRGFGFDRPVATNATPIGRAKNRRVEFNLLEGKEPGPSVEQIDEITEPPPPGGNGSPPAPGDAGTP